MQKLSLGAKESDIILPDTLEVRMERGNFRGYSKAEGEQQIDAEADTEKKARRRMQMGISAGFPA